MLGLSTETKPKLLDMFLFASQLPLMTSSCSVALKCYPNGDSMENYLSNSATWATISHNVLKYVFVGIISWTLLLAV